jgi:hypothetical protein
MSENKLDFENREIELMNAQQREKGKTKLKSLLEKLKNANGEIYKKDLISEGFSTKFLDYVTTVHSPLVKERFGIITTKPRSEELALKKMQIWGY